MWLAEVVTLAVGTLVSLVIIHFTVLFVSRQMNPAPPQVIYMQPPPAPVVQAPLPPTATFTQPPEIQQSANVPTMEPKNALPPPIRTRDDRD